MNKFAVISLSGGMDSSTLLLRLLSEGKKVTAISFDYGQKHRMELDRAKSLVNYLLESGISSEKLHHVVVRLNGIQDLLHSSLVEGGEEVPEGHYQDSNMKDTVVPNRNKIFSSIIQAAALSMSQRNSEEKVDIAMGIHAGDHAIYPDCRQEFRDADYEAFLQGNWGGERVEVYTPYLEMDKAGILYDGLHCCQILNIDFDEVYKRTNTSYKPIKIEDRWYSDYKSASSVERVEAFLRLHLVDPVEYADETGPVTWEVVTKHVQEILL